MSDSPLSTDERLGKLTKEKAKLLNLLLEAKARKSEKITPVTRDYSDGVSHMPTSWSQQRMWFVCQLEEGRGIYHVPMTLRLKGDLSIPALENAINRLIERHETLRTVFVALNGEPTQRIFASRRFDLPVIDLSDREPVDRVACIRQQQAEEASQRFDLASGPLFRGRLLRIDRHEHLLLITLHHIISDGWSVGVLLRELPELYGASLENRSARLPPLPAQYADYAQWQRQRFDAKVLDHQLDYWRAQLEGAPALLELPTDRPRPSVQTYRGRKLELVLNERLTQAIEDLAQKQGMTLFMALYAAWAILLARISGQRDIMVGTPVANRQRSEIEGLIGFFVNTLTLRVEVDDDLPIKELLKRVKQVTLDAHGHQDVPFERIVEAVRPQRSLSHHAIFQVMLVLQNAAPADLGMPGLSSSLEDPVDEPALFDLLLTLEKRDGRIVGGLDYAEDLFDRSTVERWMRCFEVLVEDLSAAEHELVADLRILPESDRQQVLYGFNSTRVPYPRERLVHELFEQQVARGPNVCAVTYGDKSLTYAELDSRANTLARFLQVKGVGPDQPVGICVERGLDMVVGLLGILKAGGAYLPLDPNYPVERLRDMLEDAAPKLVLTQKHLRATLPAVPAHIVLLDEALSEVTAVVRPKPTSDSLVYVIYTSGSTGRPKGTGMPHRAMVNLMEWHRQKFGEIQGKRVLQFAALSFDVAFQETFSTLCTGGTLVVLDEWVRRDARGLINLLSSASVERLFLPPLMLQAVAESSRWTGRLPEGLREVITAGEQLRVSPEIVEFFRKLPTAQLHNHYGPTETHVVTSLELVGSPDQWPGAPTIGRPISNTQIYILDGHRQPVPIGVKGEIYIGGAGVAPGYLNRPELTEQRFVSDPFSVEPFARMYRTGDLGRWRADGTIEFLGRNDDQVKLRGFRIELGEIEAQLLSHAQVREAVVLARDDAPGQKRLVAYVLARGESPSVHSLRKHLKAVLPEHMVPSAFVVLDSLPLTPNGKLDRRALPAPELDSYVSHEYEAPQGKVEEVLAGIWQQVLGVDRVGRQDNFFELGGHSLLIVQMMERLRRVGLSTQIREVFASRTLQDLAEILARPETEALVVPPNLIEPGCDVVTPDMLPLVQLDQSQIDQIARAVPGGASNIQDIYPLAPLQEGMLFHHLLDEHGADTYIRSMLLRLSSRKRLDEFVSALQQVINRHDVLRTAVLWEQLPRPVQVVCRQAELTVESVELDRLRSSARLDLRKAPLLQLQIAADSDDRWLALLRTHHLVFDNGSLEILLSEAMAYLRGEGAELPEPIAYRNHVAQALSQAAAQKDEAFFRGKLADVDEPTAPFGLLDVHGDGSEIQEASEELNLPLSLAVREQARRLGVSPATMFHVVWGLVVGCTSARENVVFGSVLLGRMQSQGGAQRILGMFINTLPLRLLLSGVTAQELVQQTHRELVELLAHEQASLATAQRCSGVTGSQPLFSTLLNYRHAGVDVESELTDASGVHLLETQGNTNYPIALSVDDRGEVFGLRIETDPRIDASRLLGYVHTAVQSLVQALQSNPQTPALALPILPPEERKQVLEQFNATHLDYPKHKLIHELFAEQVERTPDAMALVYQDESLTYAQLNARANQLAHYLRRLGVGPDQLVALCVTRSVEMVVGMLGVLKAGGAYVPLDPAYPPERLRFMLEDAAPKVILTLDSVRAALPIRSDESISLDGDWAQIAQEAPENINATALPHSLAYVIYTSGSTGTPKGVLVEHAGLCNLAHARIPGLDLRSDSRVLQFASISFDASDWEFIMAFCHGACLYLASREDLTPGEPLLNTLRNHRITHTLLPPVALGALPSSEGLELQTLLVGGEACPVSLAERWGTGRHFINAYGPTEITVCASTYQFDPQVEGLPIGRPISNTQIYILDAHRQPVPIGVSGEIYIGGAGVARGYLNRPELTEQRFVSDPFNGARMYRTGDLGRWRPDGTIEFLGRNDDQVKIRGFRIELGEVEAQLVRHPQVREAVVLAREDGPGQKRLVAYVIARGESPAAQSLRDHLTAALPEHMVPSAFVVLESLPLTPNGKLDRRALPAPESDSYVSREYEAPQGDVEEILAGIWQQVLGVERVGRRDNFFELGGHSLLIVQMMERLRRVGLSTQIRRVFSNPTLSDLATQLVHPDVATVEIPPNLIPAGCQQITPEMLPLVHLNQLQIDQIARSVPGGAPNIQDIYPLAPLQEGMLFHHLLDEQGADTYIRSMLLRLSSRERLDEFVSALQHVIDRHDVLRTAVLWEQLPRPLQVVYRQARLIVESVEQDRLRSNARLDLRRAPLLQLQVAADSDDQWYVLLRTHHLVFDNGSLEILLSEVMAHLRGEEADLPEPMAYRNHVAQSLSQAAAQDDEAFFRGKLADVEEPTAPFGLVDVHGDGGEIQEATEELDLTLSQRVRKQARRLGVSAATMFHVAWGLVVGGTSAREDVVFGSVLLGRMQSQAGAQRILGMFINTLPLRLRMSGVTAQEIVQQTQRELVELLGHEQASLSMAQRCSRVSSSQPLFSTLLNYRHAGNGANSDLGEATGVQLLQSQGRTNYPITLSVDDLGKGFRLELETDPRIDAHRLLGYVRTAVQSLVQALEQCPQSPAWELSILPASERHQILEQFNARPGDYGQHKLIHELFEEQAQRTPDSVAVVYENQSLSYSELNSRANLLAHYLRGRGVGPDVLVALCVERGLEMVVGILGVLKAGGAYVPLDPAYPPERLQFMLEDAKPRLLILQERLRGLLRTSASLEVVTFEHVWDQAPHNLSSAVSAPNPRSLAYVIYTSGSTGKPKGVMVEHANVTRLFAATRSWFSFDEKDVWTLFHSYAFDFSVWEIWGALLHGGRLVVVPHLIARSPGDFYELVCNERVTVLNQTPSAFAQLINAQAQSSNIHSLREVIFGGEALELRVLRPWVERNGVESPRLVNMYGITETTVHVTYRPLSREEIESGRGSPIGVAIPDLRAYLLNAYRQPVPIGVSGEIYIGGAGVARGYLNRRELTEQRFVSDPFSGAQMYRTGDLGRWRADGTIEFLGRNDAQVKIRGFRIELGEIEAQLLSHAQVREAVVLAKEDAPGQKRLVAYVTGRGESPSAQSLREHLKAVLPEHMVPSAFVILEILPLTPNGKLDRRALPAPELDSYVSGDYEAPQGEVEEVLAGIWQQVLGVDRVGRQDNFFELGGHSLLIVQMMERLRRVGLSTPIRRVFANPKLRELAAVLQSGGAPEYAVPPSLIPSDSEAITPEMLPLVQLDQPQISQIVRTVPGGASNIQDIYPLAPLQEGMLFHHLLDEQGADTYIRSMLLRLSSRERLDAFISALQRVIERHDALRTAVLWEHLPRPVQVVYRQAQLMVELISVDETEDVLAQLQDRLRSDARLDLRKAPMLQLQVAADAHGQWYALLKTHHLVFDNGSLAILLSEVMAYLRGEGADLPEPVAYRDHVAQALSQAAAQHAEAFFREKLADVEEPTAPFGLLDVHGEGSEVREASGELDPYLSQTVRKQARRLGVSAATMFHVAWGLVVACTSAREDVVFGSVLLGRLQSRAGARRILGMFINTLPLRLRLNGATVQELVQQTQRELMELLAHEQASLSVAQRASGVSGSQPLFSALLNYRHAGVDAESALTEAAGIKFLDSRGRTNYPISLSVDDLGEGFRLELETDPRIDAHRLLGYVRTAIQSLVQALEHSPESPALGLSILPPEERIEVLEQFNATQLDYPRHKLVHELFEEQAQRTPDAVAVVYDGQSMSYAELNARANQMAHSLRRHGVGPDQLVALCIERSMEMVIAILGVLKAGGAYVPLDPAYPSERLHFIVEDSQPKVVILQGHLHGLLQPPPSVKVVTLEHVWTASGEGNSSCDAIGLNPSHLAYVMYTSGSTGQPKGVMIEHRNVVNLVYVNLQCYGITPSDRVLQLFSFGFDASVGALFPTLALGATVVLTPPGMITPDDSFIRLLQDERVTIADLPTAFWHAWAARDVESEGSLPRAISLGGEKAERRYWNSWRSSPRGKAGVWINTYGPTEATVYSTALPVDAAAELPPGDISIGKPVANTHIYLLNAHRQPVPIGVNGEIYIGGAGVARGYLNRPELTEQRFVSDPFNGNRMYRTGDLGRWRADGTIEFLGRNDDQVKIRGFRIEVGEIEAYLVRHAQVLEAVVLAREDVPGQKRLVAYVISKGESPSAQALREHLKAALPEHMIPSAFVVLESLPLTASGKVNRRALPMPELDDYLVRQFEAPQGEVEEILAGIWQQVLGVDRIGRQDNFFELGGHSLLTVQVMERLRRVGLSADVRSIYKNPKLVDLASVLTRRTIVELEVPPNLIAADCQKITPPMLPLVSLDQSQIDQIVRAVPGGAANIQDIYPLAPLQEGILFHHLLNERSADTYITPTLFSVPSKETLDRFVSALQKVVDRHDVLRTAVLWEQLPRPVQVVYRHAQLAVERIILSRDRSAVDQLQEWMLPARQRLDLRTAPMIRLQVTPDLNSERWYLLMQMHHLICDHESMDILFTEVVAYLQGSGAQLPEPIAYRNHVAQALSQAASQDEDAFFRSKLADVDEPTAPFGLLDVHGDGSEVQEASKELDLLLSQALRVQARRLGVSAATMFHVVWGLVVGCTSAREDVVFGSVLLGRLQSPAGAQRILGMFINTLPLRLRLASATVQELVQQTQRELMELLAHEQASLSVAQRASGVSGSQPLFSTLLNYRHSAVAAQADWSGGTGIEVLDARERTNYPILLSVDDLGELFGLSVQTDHRVDANRLLAYVHQAVQSLVQALEQSAQAPASTLSILPPEERLQTLEQFNTTQSDYPQHKLIHELFEEQVERTPDAVALVYDEQSLSYAQLDARASQLAHHLIEQGVPAGEYIPLLMPRSLQMVVAQLAVLKVGCAYVPMDPELPVERKAFMIRDCSARWVIASERGLDREGVCWIDADVDVERYQRSFPHRTAESSSPAYVMYTSGSTGTPKGVEVPHRAVTRLVINTNYMQIRATDCVAHCSNPAFDASTFEVWGALLNGARLAILPQQIVLDPELFVAALRQTQVTVLWLTVGLFKQYLEPMAPIFRQLKYLLTGGDVVDPGLVRRVLQSGRPQHFLNGYGPTEGTTFSTAYSIETFNEGSVPIGRPISNTQIYILDTHRQPVPVGVSGEIYIGGAGVALGYLNRPELTEQRFVSDPFNGGRMYRTGDLGRWRADGTIEFLGRNDNQVKIRGFRIELGEIEAQLLRHAQVREAVVLVREDVPGQKRLVAYVIARDESPSAQSLRGHLTAMLPEHMVPGAFVVLQSLPLTPNGKLDRRALPSPELDSYVSREYEPPQGQAEEALAGIWQAVLGVDRVGREDNFFELGGHSLLIVQMMERLRCVGLTTQIRRVFSNPTLKDLATQLEHPDVAEVQVPPNLIPAGCEQITPRMLPLIQLDQSQIDQIASTLPGGAPNIQDIYPLAPLQEGMLFHHLLDETRGDTYVLPTVLSITSRDRVDAFISALQQVVDRHDVLRTAVLWEQLPQPVQVVYRRAELPVSYIAVNKDDISTQIKEWMKPERQRINLRRAPPLRLEVATERGGSQCHVLLQLHHIGGDTSLSILISEAVALMSGKSHSLPQPLPYRNHVAQALAYARTHNDEEFFRSKLGDVDEPTAPFGLFENRETETQILENLIEIDPALCRRLRAQARRAGVNPAALFHAAWGLVVAHTSGRDDVVFGTVLLGRMNGSAGAEQALGMFINTLPLRIRIGDVIAIELVRRTQQELGELLSHEQASLATAQRCSRIPPSTPLFSSLINYRRNTRNAQLEDWDSAEGIRIVSSRSWTNYPVTLSVDDLEDAFLLTAQTDRRIDPQRINNYVLTALSSLLEALEDGHHKAALELRILPDTEQHQLLNIFNATAAPYGRGPLLHELFERQVQRTPNSVAVSFEDRSLTYAELNARANQLARQLRAMAIGPDQLVGICVERSIEMVVGLFGILKSGGAYVPIDSTYPADRLAYMLEDSSPRVLLTQQHLVSKLPPFRGQLIALDADWPKIYVHEDANLDSADIGLTPRNLAYVIYTSGSTGKPKGAMNEHRGIVNRLQWMQEQYGLSIADRVLQKTPFSFDVSVWEFFWTLMTGARLIMARPDGHKDPEYLRDLIDRTGVTTLHFVPSMLQSFLDQSPTGACASLRHIVCSGEELPAALQRRCFETLPQVSLSNLYGPTEAAVDVTVWECSAEDNNPRVPIGRPIGNLQMYVLDPRGMPTPLGVPGEIFIGGLGVGRGYLNRPGLTAERFVPDPFGTHEDARLYRTGDLGRWRSDGSIEYLGRNDHQVKIRGFRIELGEIEAQLASHANVREAIVGVYETDPGDKRLVAYVVGDREFESEMGIHLRDYLEPRVPDYMIPSAWVVLDELPLTPNGKVDRRALPVPRGAGDGQGGFVEPATETERILAEIWARVLKVDRPGTEDNFFVLGGHSLLGIKLIAAIGEQFHVKLPLTSIFKLPTVKQMAAHIQSLAPQPDAAGSGQDEVETGVL